MRHRSITLEPFVEMKVGSPLLSMLYVWTVLTVSSKRLLFVSSFAGIEWNAVEIDKIVFVAETSSKQLKTFVLQGNYYNVGYMLCMPRGTRGNGDISEARFIIFK